MTMQTVQYFKATRDTPRWNANQKVWVRFLYANHIGVYFKHRGKGRYVTGYVDRFGSAVGEIKSIEVEDEFARRVLGS